MPTGRICGKLRTMEMNERIDALLRQVQRPARYVGGEYNQVIKDKADVDVRFAFCFPET